MFKNIYIDTQFLMGHWTLIMLFKRGNLIHHRILFVTIFHITVTVAKYCKVLLLSLEITVVSCKKS